MKVKVFFLFLLVNYGYSQDYKRVDSLVKKYPKSLNTIRDISKQILNDFTTDKDKVRAAFTWTALNIRYDIYKTSPFGSHSEMISYTSEYELKRMKRLKVVKKIEKTLKTRKGICQDYSLIFNKLCKKIGIPVHSIVGFSKTGINDIGNNKSFKNHMWNAVYVDNEWKLIDVTWASGYYNLKTRRFTPSFNDSYFFPSPEEFITHHFPGNQNWQLLNHKVSKEYFFSSPFFYRDYFANNFKLSDTIKGTITATQKQKNITISFDKIPKKGKTIRYTFLNDKSYSFLRLTRTKDNKYSGKIRVREKSDSQLVLFLKEKPIIGFKIIQDYRSINP
ncbi:hypothetical protein GTQ40_15465 [Flavobacteriaceae bacterium R38]|nr:hypothetical protein [Flavobacteriaceae bacterium R38]